MAGRPKAGPKTNADLFAGLRAEEHELVEREEGAQAKLAAAVLDFQHLHERAVPVLMSVLPEGQRG